MKKIAVIGATVSFSIQSTNSQDCKDGGNSHYGNGNCSVSFATNVRTGDVGSSRVFSDPAKSVGPTAGIAAAAGSGITVKSYTSASAAMTDGFDVAVVVAGLTAGDEGEEYTGAGDRTTGGINATSHTVVLGLDPKVNPGTQDKLIQQVAAAGKPTIVVLEAGGIIDMSAWYGSVQAVVMAWYPGMVGGTALGRLLFGDANFSGKLPVTWDTKASDWPTFSNSDGSAAMDYWVGYQHFDHAGNQSQPGAGVVPVRVRSVVHDLQLRELAGAVHDGEAGRRRERPGRRPQPGRRRRDRDACSCSCSTRTRRSPTGRAPPTKS